MELLPIRTGTLRPGDDVAAALASQLREGDIVIVSSKAVAAVEGRFIDLTKQKISQGALFLAEKTNRSPAFCEALIKEGERLGWIDRGACPGAVLTELRPEGLKMGTILVANAGLDESNAPEGQAIGWPEDPVRSVSTLRASLKKKTGKNVAVILTDSCCMPRRMGVMAIALTVSGLDPLVDLRGRPDLFGKKLHLTSEALADQLATAGNMLMGNAGDSVPAAIVRDHGIALSDFEGWVPGIEPDEDLFRGIV
jgi:coenzyme F420-0:L-glutamate ligase